jgi:hypothetical protein
MVHDQAFCTITRQPSPYRDDSRYPPPRDALSSSVGLCPANPKDIIYHWLLLISWRENYYTFGFWIRWLFEPGNQTNIGSEEYQLFYCWLVAYKHYDVTVGHVVWSYSLYCFDLQLKKIWWSFEVVLFLVRRHLDRRWVVAILYKNST